jgi:hypothetical protein
MVGGIVVLLFILVVGMFLTSYYYLPWWRVELRSDMPGTTLTVNRWKLAWVLDQLGYWDKGLWGVNSINKERGYEIPEKVILTIDTKVRGRYVAPIDPVYPSVRYGIEAEMREGIYYLSVGLPDGISGVEMGILNERLIKSLYGESRQGTVIPNNVYQQKYQEATGWWPRWMKKLVRVYAK